MRTRVMIVDDSALMREVLRDMFAAAGDFEVVATAPDPVAALERIRSVEVDVITLDVEMPRMSGLVFLEQLMTHRPLPVVMVSSLTERGSPAALRALELGAVDIVEKPKLDIRAGTLALADELLAKVRAAARARPRIRARTSRGSMPEAHRAGERVIAIGASTGGTEAIAEILADLPYAAPGVVLVQHLPQHFSSSFAARLDRESRIEVRVAHDGDLIRPGLALLAPGDRHMRVVKHGKGYQIALSSDPRVNGHRPAVDVLFSSVADAAGPMGVGVLLTGMGSDGARGLLRMRTAGAVTIAQDEATCVVFGMPKEAIACGAASYVMPLDGIAAATLRPG